MASMFKKLNDPQLVASFQRLCGIAPRSKQYENIPERDTPLGDPPPSPSKLKDEVVPEVTNKVLYYLFKFGAGINDEIFWLTFIPFWLWNIDSNAGRRIVLFWSLFMYVGHASKDIVRWPRPSSPPVCHLEAHHVLEYGMPSVHTMIGAGFSVSVVYQTYGRYEYPFWLGVLVCVTWTLLVCCSRIYLGMHTFLDVLVGLVFIFMLILTCFPFLDTIDNFAVTDPYAPILVVLIPLLLGLCYPPMDPWNTARGYATQSMATTCGMYLGFWTGYQFGIMELSANPPPYPIISPSAFSICLMLLRFSIGIVILLASRFIVKYLLYKLLRIGPEDTTSQRKLFVEVPCKMITYSTLTFNAVWLVPLIFRSLGVERPTYFNEL